MAEVKLKTAIVGLAGPAADLLAAARQSERTEVVAVADEDRLTCATVARQYACDAYEDYRQLVLRSELDCVLVDLPPDRAVRFIRLAIRNGLHVLMLGPPARSFEQAAELTRLAEHANVTFHVSNPARFTKAFANFKSLVQADAEQSCLLLTASCLVGPARYPPHQEPVAPPTGGVLLTGGYEFLDQIVHCFGVPDQLYAATTGSVGDRQQRIYRAEDFAVLTLIFSRRFLGTLTVRRTSASPAQLIELHCRDRTVAYRPLAGTVTETTGQNTRKLRARKPSLGLAAAVENFALSILAPDKNTPACTAGDNLKTMAVIEAAYLSARTGFPEQPRRILQMAGLSPPQDSLPQAAGKNR